MRKSVEYFKNAIARDLEYASACAGLADKEPHLKNSPAKTVVFCRVSLFLDIDRRLEIQFIKDGPQAIVKTKSLSFRAGLNRI
jgi:hypothetical protein